MASLSGFAYQRFRWLGSLLIRLFYGRRPAQLREKLEAAGIRIYPEAYMSTLGLVTLITAIPCIAVAALTGLVPLAAAPVLVLLLGYMYPSIKAQDRASKLDMEAPYSAAYISIMATGGLAPYTSIRRLEKCDLLPNTAKAAADIQLDTHLKGMDPVAAIEKTASRMPSKEFREFLMGYVHTLRVGGDVVHYLQTRTETMFRDLATKLRAFGDRAAMLMESYVAITILSMLGIVIMYLVSMAFRSYMPSGFSTENFLMFTYLLMPIISVLFIYLADLSSFQEPVYEKAPYKVFAASLPALFFLLLTMFFPYMLPELAALPFIKPFTDFLTWTRTLLGLEKGYEPTIGITIALTVATLPAALAHRHYTSKRGKSLVGDVTLFLRDLTEARKTGASPETCITELAQRHYGNFTEYLRLVARQIRWGQPFRRVYESIRRKISSWFTLINIYFLVDAVDVGGGNPDTLEVMTRYGEMQASLEKEKTATLRPLIFMPYIGAVLMVLSVVLTVTFMNQAVASIGRQTIPYVQLVSTILPSLVLQSYLTGLVTGKVSGGSLSAGFKHAILLAIVCLIIVIIAPHLQILTLG